MPANCIDNQKSLLENANKTIFDLREDVRHLSEELREKKVPHLLFHDLFPPTLRCHRGWALKRDLDNDEDD